MLYIKYRDLGNWNVLDMVMKAHFDTPISCLSKHPAITVMPESMSFEGIYYYYYYYYLKACPNQLSTIIRLGDWQTTDVRYQKPHHNNNGKIPSTWERAAHQSCWRVSVYVLQLHIQDTWWWMDWLCVLQTTHTRCMMEWTLLEYMTEVYLVQL